MDGSWGAKCLFKFRVGDWDMSAKRFHWMGEEALKCRLCKRHLETIVHCLFECDEASRLSNPFIEGIGRADLVEVWRRDKEEAAALMLGLIDGDW